MFCTQPFNHIDIIVENNEVMLQPCNVWTSKRFNIKEYQENYWSEQNPAPVPADTTTPVFNYDDDGDGIPNWEDEDYEGSVDYGTESTE